MRSLPLPTRDTNADLDVCIAKAPAASHQELVDQRPAIIGLFDDYVQQSGWDFEHANPLTHISDNVKKALLASYPLTYPRRSLKALRADILTVSDNLCPYCRLEPPLTLDHFLPKSRHQPFATFAPNLVPMCITCNRLKGTKGSKTARQFFTHAYFDELADDVPFLLAQVAVGTRHTATNFTIDFAAPIDAGVSQRIAYQFSILKLLARYQLAAIDVIAEQAAKLAEMERDGCATDALTRSIQGDAATEAVNFGHNYWKAALLSALAANVNFCEGGYRQSL